MTELSNLKCNEISFVKSSHVRISISKSKTDQPRDGDEVLSKLDSCACPYMCLKYGGDIVQSRIAITSALFLLKAR